MGMTGLIQRTAKLLIGAPIAYFGYQNLRSPAGAAKLAGPFLKQVRDLSPVPLPSDEVLVQVNAGVQVAAGSALALGLAARPAAIGLVGSLIPTTLAGHPFWKKDDPTERRLQSIQFLKNTVMVGAVLAAAWSVASKRVPAED